MIYQNYYTFPYTINHHRSVSLWETLPLFFRCAIVDAEKLWVFAKISLLKSALFCLWPFPTYRLQYQYAFYSYSDYFSLCQLTLTLPVIPVYFFSHLLLVVPIWVCVKYSSFCLLLCHTHTQLHQLFPQLLIHYFVKYQWKRTQHKLKKKNVNPIPHTASFTFTLKSWKYCPKSAKNYECICKHSKLEQYSLLVH